MNISLPSPPIGDQIPTVPDAPWMASNLDLDLLIKEEIGFGCPRKLTARLLSIEILQKFIEL